MTIKTLQLGDYEENARLVAEAADRLQAGGLVVFPTETVYGIAACATSGEGVKRLRAFKGRSANQPFTVHLSGAESAMRSTDP